MTIRRAAHNLINHGSEEVLPFLPRYTMVTTTSDETEIKFNGSNWEDLTRMIALAKFQFLQDDDYDDNEPRKCAYLSQRFVGPALDWVASTHSSQPATFERFDGFVTAVKQTFGVDENNIVALRRKQLDDLEWTSETPVFFAQFDQLTHQLHISDHGTKIAMVTAKLPFALKAELARQALSFSNYETMRERINTMWALNPREHTSLAPRSKKSRCGSCGKKGHTASECRSGSKN